MQNKIKWSAADEAALRDLEQRRKLHNDVYMPGLVAVVKRTFNRGIDEKAIAHALRQNADAIRDALEPFDSGVRPAQPTVGSL